MKSSPRKRGSWSRATLDPFILYSAAVQSTECDLDFFERVYRRTHGGERPRLLREDFCGTAALACDWVRRRPDNRAWGVDLDGRTLEWGRKRYWRGLGAERERVRLLRGDVLDTLTPPADVVCALNFSYFVFKARPHLLAYLRAARRRLRPGGLLILDAYGGIDAIRPEIERRRIASCKAFDGVRIPAFTYVWEQASFNPVDHSTVCHIHFELRRNGTTKRIRRAFTYDWRLWTLPEIREALLSAGFRDAQVYVEGWDDKRDETDGIFRRRVRFENQSGWVAYVVATR